MTRIRAIALEAPSPGIFAGGPYENRPSADVAIDGVWADHLECPLIDRLAGRAGGDLR